MQNMYDPRKQHFNHSCSARPTPSSYASCTTNPHRWFLSVIHQPAETPSNAPPPADLHLHPASFCALTSSHVSFLHSLNSTVLSVILSVSYGLHSDCFTMPPQNKAMTYLHEGVKEERELRDGSWLTLDDSALLPCSLPCTVINIFKGTDVCQLCVT